MYVFFGNNVQFKMLLEKARGFYCVSNLAKALKSICIVSQNKLSTAADSVKDDVKPKQEDLTDLRFKYPEFLPSPDLEYRNYVLEDLERKDMIKRRSNINIPEFYVGSILAVTTSDIHAPSKTTKFLGICISRSGWGLRSKFILRNVIEHQGVEVIYSLYSPVIKKIDVLRLEKRLDDELFYLRDAPLEYSTFPLDMEVKYRITEEVPINTLKVKLNPRPWLQRYERMNLRGVILPQLSDKIMKKAKAHEKPWEKYDLMQIYRKTIPEEEQKEILADIGEQLKQLEVKQKMQKQKKDFIKPLQQKLF